MKVPGLIITIFTFVVLPLLMVPQSNSAKVKHEIKGSAIDNATGEPLIGVAVAYANGKGTFTDLDGNYLLLLPDGNYTLTMSYIGYQSQAHNITVSGEVINIETIKLEPSVVLDEVEVAADIARTRETPIAFSDISSKQIGEELGANDITLLLNSTPGAYATQQGGGIGDSRVNIRGFDQKNVAVLVDGIPVNDMENGQVYWSNWLGLSDITRKMQVQRGLGASRLAVPSVGGVINIVSTAVDYKRYFIVKNEMGSNNFRRFSASYNSGIIKNKFGVTLSGSYSDGNGYIDQTWFKAWSYFAKFSYKINHRQLLVFGFNGAPQSHAQRSYAINMVFHDKEFAEKHGINADSVYKESLPFNPYTNERAEARGIRYSPDWGYINGKPYAAKVNRYHKPLFNLSYFYDINSKLNFSNVLYFSLGNGGGSTLSSFAVGYDRNGTGQLNLQSAYDENYYNDPNRAAPGEKPSKRYVYESVNNHKWVGTLSTLKYSLNKKFEFMGGFDARTYNGIHYQSPIDFLGGNYIFAPPGKDFSLVPLGTSMIPPTTADSTSQIRRKGDKINYHYESRINWLGLFTQAEYKTENITAFVTLTSNRITYQSTNYFEKKNIAINDKTIFYRTVGYGDTLYYDGVDWGVSPTNVGNLEAWPVTKNPDGGITFTDFITGKEKTLGPNYKMYHLNSPEARAHTTQVKVYFGYTAKGGLNYKINRNHNVFANVGYMSQAPRYTNVFDRSGREVQNITNQLITSGELGYSVKYRYLAANVNVYITQWNNRPIDFAKLNTNSQDPVYYNIPGVNARLKGVEFDVNYKPIKYTEVRVFGMLADWRWVSSGKAYITTNEDIPLDTVNFDVRNVHLGNAPQRQLGGSVRFEAFKGFYIKPQVTYFSKMYAQFDPSTFDKSAESVQQVPSPQDAWEMPAYWLLDVYTGYTIVSGRTILNVFASMNNVLNTIYLSDATTTTANGGAYTAYNTYGWMGLGRRMTMGVKFTF